MLRQSAASAACVLVLCAPAGGQESRQKAGGLLLPSAPATRDGFLVTSEIGTADETVVRSSPVALPPIRIRVTLREVQETVPEDLRTSLADQAMFADRPQPYGLAAETREIELDASADALTAALEDADVESIEIVRPPTIGVVQPIPFNLDARITHLVGELEGEYPDMIDGGSSVVVGVFDGGPVLDTHNEFASATGSRVMIHPSVTLPTSRHATHVAGTIAAAGRRATAKGMAFKTNVISLDWNNDLSNLQSLGGEISVSNHSYGPPAGWSFDPNYNAWFWWGDITQSDSVDARFGKYTSQNSRLDEILLTHPSLLTVVAAGNDRNDGPSQQPILHYVIGRDQASGSLQWRESSAVRPGDGEPGDGLDTVVGLGLSKNALCVGAIHDVVNQGDSIRPTSFTGYGPTDDHRIKPDVVANGQTVFSVASASDDAYVTLSGTSMASPTTAGIATLLHELFVEKFGRGPTSMELKAAIIHTAVDAGEVGPDPIFGWGSIDALRAGRVIAGSDLHTIKLGEVRPGVSAEFSGQLHNSAGGQIKVTVVWLDPAAPANLNGLDDNTRTLVDDLDLEVRGPDGSIHYPYSLVPSSPFSPAVSSGPNSVDNVEVVSAPATPGEWHIAIKPTSLGSNGPRRFAIVTTGLAFD